MYKNIMTLLLSIILLTGCNNGAQRSQTNNADGGSSGNSKTTTETKIITCDIDWYSPNQDYFEISTAEQFIGIAYLVINKTDNFKGATLKLMQNIDLSNAGKDWNDGRGWIPIGDREYPFQGKFDGNNKKITGLYINDPTRDYAGLFGNSTETITNLGIDVNITAGDYVGGVVGLGDCTNCSATGTVSGNRDVGGVTGTGSCENCYAAVSVRGANEVGGVTGRGGCSTCYATGAVSGNNEVGGVIGNGGCSTCYATGAVSGNNNVGGVTGNGGCSTCYATGAVSGANLVFGIGYGSKTGAALNPSITRSSRETNIYRVTNQGSNNVAWSDMVLQRGSDTTITEGLNSRDGASVSAEEVTSADFWLNNPDVWGKDNAWDTDIWDIADGRLPILKNMGGNQLANNPPAHLK